MTLADVSRPYMFGLQALAEKSAFPRCNYNLDDNMKAIYELEICNYDNSITPDLFEHWMIQRCGSYFMFCQLHCNNELTNSLVWEKEDKVWFSLLFKENNV